MQDGIEDMLDHWRICNRKPGNFVDTINGEVWKTLWARSGRLFFDNNVTRSHSDEFRIDLTFSMDG